MSSRRTPEFSNTERSELSPLEFFHHVRSRRWRAWAIVSGVSFGAFLLLGLLFVPQAYTSNLSLAVLQPTDVAAGLLGTATGLGSSPTGKYIGVLRSRHFAEQVEDCVHLQKLYHLPTRADAVEAILDGVSVKDGAKEGLLYVSVTLHGPSLLAPNGQAQRDRVNQTAALAANAYADILRNYMATSDVDRDSILLQGAHDQIKQVRADYDAAVARLANLVRTRGAHMQDAMPGAEIATETPGGSSGTANMAKGIQSLYMMRASLDSDIQAEEAALAHLNKLETDQLNHLNGLPSEDPILMQARAAVDSAQADFEATRLQYGPDHPKVVVAQDRLNIAHKTLRAQTEAIRSGRTTPQISATVKLDALKTRYAALLREIAASEGKAKIGRDFMTEFESQRNEVILRLEVLKAASAHAATLSLQTVAASKKLSVVDVGEPARRSTPGPLLMALLSLFMTGFGMAGWLMVDYRATQQALAQCERQIDSTSESLEQAA